MDWKTIGTFLDTWLIQPFREPIQPTVYPTLPEPIVAKIEESKRARARRLRLAAAAAALAVVVAKKARKKKDS